MELLDDMVSEGEIRDNRERYAPALLALSELDDPEVREFLDDCATVLPVLRMRYLSDQTDLISVDDLSQRSDLPRERFARGLFYLNANCTVLAGSKSMGAETLAEVLPAEEVLTLRTMDDVFKELRGFRALRVGWGGFPQSDVRSVPVPSPSNQVKEELPWLKQLPLDLQTLLAEIYAAQRVGLRSLAVMGVRAAIDMTCNHLVGDAGGFEAKLNKLKSEGHVSESQRQTLHAVVQLGHAAAHRGHLPNAEDVDDVLDILERALKSQYVDPHTTQRLRQSTPPRV
jgi:hypothetical protein